MTEILFAERLPVAARMKTPGDVDQHHHQQRMDLPVQRKAAAVVAQQRRKDTASPCRRPSG
ncbi:Uncharacterised protein [Serratia plymuthica]|nr:Uncharacterised protein [Serratia plymuthica]